MNNTEFFNNESSQNRDIWRYANGSNISKEDLIKGPAPFIFQIVNDQSAPEPAIADVDIGDAARNRTSATFNLNSHITVTSAVQGINYREFLAISENSPFLVGAIMIISTSAGQLDQTVKITHRNASGDEVGHVISPTITLNQRQTDRVADDYEFMFDSLTRIRFNQINAGATVTIRIYPKEIYSSADLLARRGEIERFGKPRLY